MSAAAPASRIILVEDDAEMRSLLASSLRTVGYIVDEVGGGDEAIALLRSNQGPPVDLVVSDIRMPQGSGIDVLVWVRRYASQVPVILITGFGDHSRQRARALGAHVILDKPFALHELRRCVAEALD